MTVKVGADQDAVLLILLAKKMVAYDHIRITRMTAIDISEDVAKCFDRMIEACMNLSCRQQGADLKYLKLHALLQQTFQYYVKHAQGISSKFNQHSRDDPWYGAGQGAGDACLRWIVQANSIIKAYESRAEPWILYSPNYDQHYRQLLDAFVDDTDIFAAQQPWQSFREFVANLQSNLNLWHDLLQVSGGVLNPLKCVWLCFNWHIGATSRPTIIPPPPHTQLNLMVQGHPPEAIPLLDPGTAHRYLGVYLTTDGNCRTELNTFSKRNAQYVQLMRTCPFSRHEASTVYCQCYLPTVGYPLPATFMPPHRLHKIQSPATAIFLTKMGFPRTFP